MPRFYLDAPLASGHALSLPESLARHVQVLRMQPGEAITLFNGLGGEYAATVTAMGKRNVDVEVGGHDPADRESPLQTVLLQAVSAAERMDYTVQKATELGVSRIVPVYSQYCQQRLSGERAEKRLAHWRAVAAAACEQSGRTRVPQIDPVAPLADALAELPQLDLRLLMSPVGAVPFRSLADRAGSLAMLVGPEGGLSSAEEQLAIAAGFTPLVLGPRILRTETAGPALLALAQARWGDG
ncbi:16S rRNA (uracil(1498)-N(3))-methyltransferase [Jeongeupia naejangsanensis]|uniref:Ribosomal RNA small subunit methyltransferase E n=1 Tax=Jeongeupia naejangsanensis TaxID=613195 RepID=A0ABS2BM48_9NEIS|nr:16S rRNA (uracil(1498)-N(3))-methyltransferase [Jeongeupia naejangsanensis]MBM3116525.1 16S rRNA (uracil(1498)-N(3))-methyltransferase [Jeongeupia naejangsanensis]